MSLYRRGKVWWFEFKFRGQRVRESAETTSKTLALRVEDARRRALVMGASGIKKIQQPSIFTVVSKSWFETGKGHWSTANARIEHFNLRHLQEYFGRFMLTDITGDDVSRYQAVRKKQNASPKTINLEVGTLRAIMRKQRLWANIQPDVRMLRVRTDVGRALSADEQHRLLTAAKTSRSRQLYPAILLSLHTGMRNGELRTMKWGQVDLLGKTVTTGKGKTAGGEDRMIPLSDTAWLVLKEWRSAFPNAEPNHFVFPSERYGLAGDEGRKHGMWQAYDLNVEKPISSWKVAWNGARRVAKVACRWHDMRHTFVSRMAEGQASDTTIMALSGHLSRKMMERYSHIRGEAKRSAISALDLPMSGASGEAIFESASPQIPPQ